MKQQIDQFSALRQNMVETQIRTNGVINETILQAFETTPREKFVPDNMQPVAYTDKYIALNKERTLMDPMTHARLLQALNPQKQDVCLDIAGATGYNSCLLSKMTMTVVMTENRQNTIDKTMKSLNDMQQCNIIYVKTPVENGAPEQGPYDIILINGAVANIPDTIAGQLAVGGRLGFIHKETPSAVGQAKIIHRTGESEFTQEILFEAEMPYLSAFAPKVEFAF